MNVLGYNILGNFQLPVMAHFVSCNAEFGV